MRPLGVTLSACFEFLRGLAVVLFALGVYFVTGMASRVAALAAEGSTLQRALHGFGRFIGTALLIYALILIALGAGLLLRQSWARFLTIVFSFFSLLLLLPRILHFRPLSVLFFLLNVAVIIYLSLPDTRLWFANKIPDAAKSS
jgi:Predicted membrane protein (DUF2127)